MTASGTGPSSLPACVGWRMSAKCLLGRRRGRRGDEMMAEQGAGSKEGKDDQLGVREGR